MYRNIKVSARIIKGIAELPTTAIRAVGNAARKAILRPKLLADGTVRASTNTGLVGRLIQGLEKTNLKNAKT
jgi:hypothetical protein